MHVETRSPASSRARSAGEREQSRMRGVVEAATSEDFPRPQASSVSSKEALTRRSGKEVIQPQVPLRLPCYDFAPVTALALGGLVPCGFRHRLRALTASMA